MTVEYFTFGAGQFMEGRCQPIVAEDPLEARKKMFELYGNQWSFQYSEKQYLRNRLAGFSNEILLEPVFCEGCAVSGEH